MATAKDFVDRIDQVNGVAGCLLTRNGGEVIGQTLTDPEVYLTLLQFSRGLSAEIMERMGFSYCRYISFNRMNNQNFYLFPIDNYMLGLVQQEDCSVAEMLEEVYRLIGRVSIGGPRTVS